MTLVAEEMKQEVVTVSDVSTVRKAAELMERKDKGLLVVVDAKKKPVGVFTDTDVIRRVLLENKDPNMTLVQDVMTLDIFSIAPENTLSDAVKLMRKHKIKRLPVIDKTGRLQGIISTTDLINSFLDYKRKLLDLAIEF